MMRRGLTRVAGSRLVPGVVGGLVVAVALAGPGAWASVMASNPPASASYTGCLGHTTGSIYDVKPGSAPLATCTGTDKQIKLSAGDITSVTAGTGLTGGASKGAASLAIDPAHLLPQSCEPGTSPTPSGTGTWTCDDSKSQGFAYGLNSGADQSVQFGQMEFILACTSAVATLQVNNLGPDPAFFNVLVGPLNGTVGDKGFQVNPGTSAQIASNGGGTANYVWDEDGVIVTGTVTWYLEGTGGACQFDGDMIRATF